jgi:phage gp46-like protein
MTTLSTYINAKTHDYEVISGTIALANELATEAYTRIVTPLGSYYFDPEFGSELANFIGRRQNISSRIILKAIENALSPMKSQNRVSKIIIQLNTVTNNFIEFTLNVFDINTNNFKFTVPYYGVTQ